MNGAQNTNGDGDALSLSDTLLTNLDAVPSTAFKDFINGIDAVMFDCDGVLWLGNETMKDAQRLVIKLRSMGKKVFFATNNSTKTREEFLVKFNKLGFEATVEEIVSTSYLAALYLKEKNFKKKVYVIGTTGVTQELKEVGIETLAIGPDPVNNWDLATGGTDRFSIDSDVGAVVVGFDQHLSFAKLFKAATYLERPGTLFIATNTDERFPVAGNYVLPGTGSIVSAVRTAAERDPVVMGKPSQIMFEFIKRSYNLDPNRILMIGDRCNTDILFGRNCNMWTLLVLTGVSTLAEVEKWKSSGTDEQKKLVPNFYLPEVSDLLALINKNTL